MDEKNTDSSQQTNLTSRCRGTSGDYLGDKKIALIVFWGAPPRPPDPPIYVGGLRAPTPPLMSASGLPIYRLSNKNPNQ